MVHAMPPTRSLTDMAPETLHAERKTTVSLTSDEILRIENLALEFSTDDGILHAITQVDLRVNQGEAVGIVGESGCGKSVLSETILRLVPSPPGRITKGTIHYRMKSGEIVDLAAISPQSKLMRSIRGNEISMIFQEPMTSLNPIFSIGEQIAEVIRLHQRVTRKEAFERAVALLSEVHMPAPRQRAREYPHQISGGMRQRAMIAIALACEPNLLIADEPTTALDVTVQAQILKLIRELQEKRHMSVIFISHDLGVISEVCDRVAVMYLGHMVEQAPMEVIFSKPSHPYTQGLLGCIPDLAQSQENLFTIPGSVPTPINLAPGCPFASRCGFVMDRCRKEMPPFNEVGTGHRAACWLNDSAKP